VLHQIAETEKDDQHADDNGPWFSWLSLTSGLFDRLRINFLSTVLTTQGPKSISLRTPLDIQRRIHEVGNSEAILARTISLHIRALERQPIYSEVRFLMGRRFNDMLTVTKKAAALLKAAKAAEGAADGAGIRLRMGAIPDDSDKVAIGLAICEEPDPND